MSESVPEANVLICEYPLFYMGIRSRLLRPLIPKVINEITLSLNSGSVSFKTSNVKQYEWVRDFGREKGILLEFLDELKKDDIFFDIGAGYGIYTCFAGNIISEGEIIAFEPFSDRSEMLKQNINTNQITARVVEKVLWDDQGNSEVGLDNEKSSIRVTNTGEREISNDTKEVQSIPKVPADSLIEQGKIPEPTILKIDVEGSEVRVLRGLEKTLQTSKCRTVFCEIHFPMGNSRSARDYDDDPYEVYDLLREHGFSITQLDPNANRPSVHLIRADK
ncbi:FkbM family methyltransferase [Halorubrum trapanicum]|uniref:FkbM family methyltransferase n=1 Tax=Halorubrum trapanicum TaxID=29284 RepID=UPI0012FDC337|nr:FkbM family methyltransferase [Halorubrum trapanicum]